MGRSMISLQRPTFSLRTLHNLASTGPQRRMQRQFGSLNQLAAPVEKGLSSSINPLHYQNSKRASLSQNTWTTLIWLMDTNTISESMCLSPPMTLWFVTFTRMGSWGLQLRSTIWTQVTLRGDSCISPITRWTRLLRSMWRKDSRTRVRKAMPQNGAIPSWRRDLRKMGLHGRIFTTGWKMWFWRPSSVSRVQSSITWKCTRDTEMCALSSTALISCLTKSSILRS